MAKAASSYRRPQLFKIAGGVLRTPRRAPTRIALQTRAVAHQREVAAGAAGFAFVAFGAGFGAAFGGDGFGVGANVGHLLERLGGREFLLNYGFEHGGAGDFGARSGSGEGGDDSASACFARRPSRCGGG